MIIFIEPPLRKRIFKTIRVPPDSTNWKKSWELNNNNRGSKVWFSMCLVSLSFFDRTEVEMIAGTLGQ